MAKISELTGYDVSDLSVNDQLIIYDKSEDVTKQLSLNSLSQCIKAAEDLDLSLYESLSANLDSKFGVSWVVNPQIYAPKYLVSCDIITRTTLPQITEPFNTPFKFRFKPMDECCGTWRNIPYHTLKPDVNNNTHHLCVMNITCCTSIIATVTFSHDYIGKPFIFTDEAGISITHYNTGERLTFKEGSVSI